MAPVELKIVRSGSPEFIVQALPDGSTAIFEVATKNVYSLNPSAAAAWEACASATTLSRLATAMSRRLNRPVTEDLAHEAVSELVAVGLVTATPRSGSTSRRELLKQAAEVAIPVVLVLTGVDQRAHAQTNGSNPPLTTTVGPGTTTPVGITTTREPVTFEIFKSRGTADLSIRDALEGAEFDVKNAQGIVVAHLTTDVNGHAEVELPPGTYTIIETFAPGGPYLPLGPVTVTLTSVGGNQGRDLHNVILVTKGT
jgi:uncharacterized surface anchored protein